MTFSSPNVGGHLLTFPKRSRELTIPKRSRSQNCQVDMGVSKNKATPKWMVKIMENPMNKWMIWEETPLFWKHPYSRLNGVTNLDRSDAIAGCWLVPLPRMDTNPKMCSVFLHWEGILGKPKKFNLPNNDANDGTLQKFPGYQYQIGL